jgi:hypothetical protein
MAGGPVIAGLVLGAGVSGPPPMLVRNSNKSSWTGSEGAGEDARAAASGCLGSPSLLFEFPVMWVLKDMPIPFPARLFAGASVRRIVRKADELSAVSVLRCAPLD